MEREGLKRALKLYAVTDSRWLCGESLAAQVERAKKGGATLIQLREKELDQEHFLQEAAAVKEVCRRYRIPLIINDDVELALKVHADGVHVGQNDMEASDVRKILGEDKMIGVSAQTVEQALLAEAHGADYLGVGSMFATGTKTDAVEVSKDTLRAICQTVSIPVVAIGGISRDNVMELAGSGICGIAVVSAIFAQPDIRRAAEDLAQITEQMLGRTQ